MAFPAVPRNAKGYDIENAINRILRWLNPGFGADNAGKVLTSNSTGTDLEWADIPYPTLTAATTFLTADVLLNNTSTWFDGPNTGSIGAAAEVWWIAAKAVVTDTSGAAGIGARIYDGTNGIDSAAVSLPAANSGATLSLGRVVTLTAATTFTLQVKDLSFTTGKLLTSDGIGPTNKATSITAIRLS